MKNKDFSYSSFAKSRTKQLKPIKKKIVLDKPIKKVRFWLKISSFFAAFFSIMHHIVIRIFKNCFELFELSIFSGLSKSRKFPIERVYNDSINSFLKHALTDIELEPAMNLNVLFSSNFRDLNSFIYSNNDLIEKKMNFILLKIVKEFYKSEYFNQLTDVAKRDYLNENALKLSLSELNSNNIKYLSLRVESFAFTYDEKILENFVKDLRNFKYLKIKIQYKFDVKTSRLFIQVDIPDLKSISKNNIFNYFSRQSSKFYSLGKNLFFKVFTLLKKSK
ncbi:MAG: hypothetical protein HRT47_04110 [Candidatus Caenarcaniphilales bacterium]|nr:hypothetical protein [Candidatus Caenarcaniphilales bacterium]